MRLSRAVVYGCAEKQDNPPSLGFAVLLAARVRLFKELVEVFLLIRGARGSMAAGVVPAVVVTMARHRYVQQCEGAVGERRRGSRRGSVRGPTMFLLKDIELVSGVRRELCSTECPCVLGGAGCWVLGAVASAWLGQRLFALFRAKFQHPLTSTVSPNFVVALAWPSPSLASLCLWICLSLCVRELNGRTRGTQEPHTEQYR